MVQGLLELNFQMTVILILLMLMKSLDGRLKKDINEMCLDYYNYILKKVEKNEKNK